MTNRDELVTLVASYADLSEVDAMRTIDAIYALGMVVVPEAALAAMYEKNFKAIADLCDLHLDRSGALLGRVRELAQEQKRAMIGQD